MHKFKLLIGKINRKMNEYMYTYVKYAEYLNLITYHW